MFSLVSSICQYISIANNPNCASSNKIAGTVAIWVMDRDSSYPAIECSFIISV